MAAHPIDSVLYHNPNCTKSRGALDLLRGRGIEPRIVAYLEQPPTAEGIAGLLQLLGVGPRGLLRTSEADYAALGLDDTALDDATLIQAMCRHPNLIERPVFVHAGRAVIGRPPERVLELLTPR